MHPWKVLDKGLKSLVIFFNLKSIGVEEMFFCVDWGIFFVARITYTQKQNQNVSETASQKQIDQWLCTICDALAHVAWNC